MKKEMQDLRCGDVFSFREGFYVTLGTFTDNRHTQTIIFCVTECDFTQVRSIKDVFVVRGFRTLEVIVSRQVDLNLCVLDVTQQEIPQSAIARLEEIRK